MAAQALVPGRWQWLSVPCQGQAWEAPAGLQRAWLAQLLRLRPLLMLMPEPPLRLQQAPHPWTLSLALCQHQRDQSGRCCWRWHRLRSVLAAAWQQVQEQPPSQRGQSEQKRRQQGRLCLRNRPSHPAGTRCGPHRCRWGRRQKFRKPQRCQTTRLSNTSIPSVQQSPMQVCSVFQHLTF